jgi:hypothetical protein
MYKAPFLGSFLTLICTVIQESQAEMKVKIDEMEIRQDDIKVKERLFIYTLEVCMAIKIIVL